jgi:CarD family transcriptional regulator
MEEQLKDLEIVQPVANIEFEVGDNVVYPHHGAGKVIRKELKEVLGESREYLTIKILHNDMTVMVPTANAALAGLRRVIDEATVQAQPRQDQDRRHLRAGRGGAQPRHARSRKGPVHG